MNTPEKDTSSQPPLKQAAHIQGITNSLLKALEAKDVHKISQLLMQRRQGIEGLRKSNITSLSQDEQDTLSKTLEAIATNEKTIERKLKHIGSEIESLLQRANQSKSALSQYKGGDAQTQQHTTRSQNA